MTTLFDTGPELTTTALAPWFGSNRMLAPLVGQELRGCKWVGVPFGGGMAEVAHIKASTIVVSDLHRHVINLALCVKSDEHRGHLVRILDSQPFHPTMLEAAQRTCERLDRCEDAAGHGLYCDPPFPGPGDRYKHRFTEVQHETLARRLAAFKLTRVVCRFYDHPLIRRLYPEGQWTWRILEGRKQSNEKAPEVLIVNAR